MQPLGDDVLQVRVVEHRQCPGGSVRIPALAEAIDEAGQLLRVPVEDVFQYPLSQEQAGIGEPRPPLTCALPDVLMEGLYDPLGAGAEPKAGDEFPVLLGQLRDVCA